MFGCYFHSIICHAPILYRIISLRSINTEKQLFGSAKGIAKCTSNQHRNHIIQNIVLRTQEEAKVKGRESKKKKMKFQNVRKCLNQKQAPSYLTVYYRNSLPYIKLTWKELQTIFMKEKACGGDAVILALNSVMSQGFHKEMLSTANISGQQIRNR